MLTTEYWQARQLAVRRCLEGLSRTLHPAWVETLGKYLQWLRRKEIEAEGRRGPS